MKDKLPTDDSPASVRKRMKAVYDGNYPIMPKLSRMTKTEMARTLQSLWTVLDETGVQRRNETSSRVQLSIYGRVITAIRRGPLVKEKESGPI